MSEAIDQAADELTVLPFNLSQARHCLAGHSMDILFYPEIGIDPLTYFLAFSRLAPVQCTTWGHPDTTGIPNMDFFLSSRHAEPSNAQDHYSERLFLLERFVMYCYRPKLSAKQLTREQFGFSKNQNLYVCPQHLFKFHPDFDGILRAILRKDRHAMIILFEGEHAHWTRLLRDRFSRVFPNMLDRVCFQPRISQEDFFSFLNMSDVILDTPHFNGGYTSMLSFACGAPIVTWPGQFMRTRLTLALYKQMGILDCIADSADAYVDLSLRLAGDHVWRDEIKEKIRTRAHVLFEDHRAISELQRFFEWAVKEPHESTSSF
ncbi:MAG: hypothetical protein JRF37_09315 [Deltaproteobacteria bacterium]|nr:hypothetical protein [Deltaproteobacteria bacterium]